MFAIIAKSLLSSRDYLLLSNSASASLFMVDFKHNISFNYLEFKYFFAKDFLIHCESVLSCLSKNKVLIFTEYQTTARYLARQLENAGIGSLVQVDSARDNASEAVHAFAPYYNELSSKQLADAGKQEIRVLVSTDILAEGLNLQDATCIINPLFLSI